MDEYRRNLYTLRRLVLCGSDMQRGQVAYVLIQVLGGPRGCRVG